MSCNRTEMPASKSVTDEVLCDCVVQNDSGEWDGQLSEDCIKAYMERFEGNLDAIHEWYTQHCPDYQLQSPKPKIVI